MRHCLTRLHNVNDEIFIFHICCWSYCLQGPGGSMSYVVGLPNNWYSPITNTAWVRAGFVNYKKGALDSQPQVIKFTICLPMVDDSLRVLRLLPPLTLPWSSWYSWSIAKCGVKLLVIVFSVLRFTAPDYSFGIFNFSCNPMGQLLK
jgi:hypothetical protein